MRKLSSLTLPWPTDWESLFGLGAGRPLILEIGFGYGQFLFHLARQNPGANVIGLEISNRCLTTVEDKLARNPIPNVCVLRSTAETALHHLFEPASLAQVVVNFPDPWFKTRHEHRRLMQRDTLDAIVNRLTPGGLFHLATDILEYAEMSHSLLVETSGLDNLLPAAWAESPLPGRVATKYEGKAQREGRPCYYFAYRRNNYPTPEVPVITELDMPHLVFSSPLSLDEMLSRFAPTDFSEGETHVSFMHAYRGERALLFEVFVKEPTIDQHFAIMLLERDRPNEYTIQLGTLGHPRATRGVHLAVSRLGQWLLSLHSDARILKRKVAQEP